jgi:uncharacterized protein YbaA (DUF1428 family)
MTYVDGYVLAVPTADKAKFVEMAKSFDGFFTQHGALRVVECWGDDVPHGKLTDFFMSVQAKEDETVVFSWVEWPDKATRDGAMAKMHEMMKTDERYDPVKNPPCFDGKRMIFGGFTPVLVLEK